MNYLVKFVIIMILLSLVKVLITIARVGGHDPNPTSTTSSALEFILSSLATASDEQYESISDDEITILVRKFHALHKFDKERSRSSRGYFKCGDTTHFIVNNPMRKKLNSCNKYNYSKGDSKKKNRFIDKKKKKKKFQKIMS
jgi:hypothetical protein